MPPTSRTLKQISSVECLCIDTRPTTKERVYSLLVTWSDGSTTQPEVLQSDLVDLRTRLNNSCYRSRPDVVLPEVPPATTGRVDVKRDEKRKKAIQEFCQQILKLPDVADKTRIVNEFFSKSNSQSSTSETVSSTPLYAQIQKVKMVPKPPTLPAKHNEANNGYSDDAIQYADLEFTQTCNTGVIKSADDEPDILYAEVIPQQPLAARLVQQSNIADAATDNPATPLYLNVPSSPTSRPYENIIIGKPQGKPQDTEKRYYKVVQNYIPKTTHSQGMAVDAGDIIQVQEESGGRVYGLLCAKSTSTVGRQLEGWLPMRVLAPCQPDVVQDTDSPVPVVRDPSPIQPVKSKPEAKSRGALKPKNLSVDKKDDSNGVAFTSDAYILNAHSNSSSAAIPVMPDILSPSLSLPAGRVVLEKLVRMGKPTLPAAVSDQPQSACVHVIAVADYTAPVGSSSGVLAFKRGDVAELIYSSETQWWCVRLNQQHGWVPADYWGILADDGRIGSGDTAPWMVGVLGREECEQMMLKYGKEQDYVIRESKNLSGQYALSIKCNDRLHHFPIVPTEDGKFYIGKHHFSTINNVVVYYTKNTLFVDDSGRSVTLGSPFKLVT